LQKISTWISQLWLLVGWENWRRGELINFFIMFG
jgi:hypothetical protein